MATNMRYPSAGAGDYSSNYSALPARMDAEATAKFLGFREHDIPVLVSLRHLEPLGNPAPNARKYFARVLLIALSDDASWLSKATKLLYRHWENKNAGRKTTTKGSESSHPE